MGKPQDITQSQHLSMGKIETVYVYAMINAELEVYVDTKSSLRVQKGT